MTETAVFKAGKSFGEKAIEENKPRAATVYVKSDSILVAVLTKSDYKKVIGDAIIRQQEKQIDKFLTFNALSGMGRMKMRSLAYYFVEKTYSKGM